MFRIEIFMQIQSDNNNQVNKQTKKKGGFLHLKNSNPVILTYNLSAVTGRGFTQLSGLRTAFLFFLYIHFNLNILTKLNLGSDL